MAQNRVQYQKGLSMPEVFDRFGSVQQCEERVRAWRWPSGFVCPRCEQTGHSEFRRHDRLYFQCSSCRYQCSLVSGTIFESSKLPLPRWFLAMHLMTQAKNNVSALELKRHLGVSYPTAWLLKHKIMEAMRVREECRQLHGRVEMDDAYLGGERTGGKPGRGSENKVPFVAAVRTIGSNNKPHQICLSQLPFRRSAIAEFCAEHLVRPLTVVSDGLDCFTMAAAAGVHQRIVTGGGRSSAQHPEFAAVNIVLSNLKTALTGTYHAFKFSKYAPRYLAEFQFRFNRRYRMHKMLPRMLQALIAATPLNTAQIRAPELPC